MFVPLRTIQRTNDGLVHITSNVRWDRIASVMVPAGIAAEKDLKKEGMKAIVVAVDGSQVVVENTPQEVMNAVKRAAEEFPVG